MASLAAATENRSGVGRGRRGPGGDELGGCLAGADGRPGGVPLRQRPPDPQVQLAAPGRRECRDERLPEQVVREPVPAVGPRDEDAGAARLVEQVAGAAGSGQDRVDEPGPHVRAGERGHLQQRDARLREPGQPPFQRVAHGVGHRGVPDRAARPSAVGDQEPGQLPDVEGVAAGAPPDRLGQLPVGRPAPPPW